MSVNSEVFSGCKPYRWGFNSRGDIDSALAKVNKLLEAEILRSKAEFTM